MKSNIFFLPFKLREEHSGWEHGSAKWDVLRMLWLGARCTQSHRCLCVETKLNTLMSSLDHMQTAKFKCLSLKITFIGCFMFKELLFFQTDLLPVKEICIYVPLFFPKDKTWNSSLQTLEYFQKLVQYMSVLFSIFHIYTLHISNTTCPLVMLVFHDPLGHLGK